MDRRAILSFVVSGTRLALPLEDVRRVVPLPLLDRPAAAPPFVEGFFDLGGAPVTAVRLDRLLGFGEEELGVYSPLLVLRDADPQIALHVAQVTSLLKVGAADIQPIGRDETFNACVVGRLTDDGETVYLLSASSILLVEERAAIAALAAIGQRRSEALADGRPEAIAHAS